MLSPFAKISPGAPPSPWPDTFADSDCQLADPQLTTYNWLAATVARSARLKAASS